MQKIALVLFILLSCITQSFAGKGGNAILARLTLSDVFGGLAILCGLNALVKSFFLVSKMSSVYQGAIFLLVCFFAPILFSFNVTASLIECLIILFLILISIKIFYEFKDKFLTSLMPLIMVVSLFASFLGIYSYAASMTGLPEVFPSRAPGEILGGFRNAGQEGAYFLVLVAILFPLRRSSLYHLMDRKYRRLLNVSLLVAIVFLFLSGKIAAYVGLVFGVFLYAVMMRNAKTILSIAFFGVLLFGVYVNLEAISPKVYHRITKKYETRIDSRLEGEEDDNDFMHRNYGKAIDSFIERPLTGTVIGGFAGSKYGSYEVHSTYFKLLGETGFIGTFGYMVFVLSLFKLFRYRKYRRKNPYADYLYGMFPFVIGCFISWGYTYHLRKREFWILVAIIVIAVYQYHVYNKKLRDERENI